MRTYREDKSNRRNVPTRRCFIIPQSTVVGWRQPVWDSVSSCDWVIHNHSDSPFFVIGRVADYKVAKVLLHLRSGQLASIKVVVSLPFDPVVPKLRQYFSEWRWGNLFCYRTTVSLERLLSSLTWQALICVKPIYCWMGMESCAKNRIYDWFSSI